MKLRSSSPAPTSSTSASATSTTTNAPRMRFPREPDPERPPSFNESVRLVPEAVNAGTTPKTSPHDSDATTVKSSTDDVDADHLETLNGQTLRDDRPQKAECPPGEEKAAKTPPMAERTRLSASNCRTSRARAAPSAARTASSR